MKALSFGLGLALLGCGGLRYGVEPLSVTMNSLSASFAWEPFAAPSGATELTYELHVLRDEDGGVAYAKKGIASATHTTERELAPATTYRWRVRPWFLYQGERRAGPWSHVVPRSTPPGRPAVVPITLEYFPSFTTPQVIAK